MTVKNGQVANQTTFNDAFISRKEDSDTVGKIDLKNTDTADITDVQATINTNITDIGTNTTNIGTNTTNISTNATNIQTLNDEKGAANGIAELDGTGKVPATQLPALGGLSYQGLWNASINSPDVIATPKLNGYYWVVSVAGNTDLDGITDWEVGDWAIWNGTIFQKIDQSNAVTSVNGQTGTVVLDADDIAESTTRFWDVKNARNESTDPGVNNDTTEGYVIGSSWFNSTDSKMFFAKSVGAGAAVWVETSGGGSVPETVLVRGAGNGGTVISGGSTNIDWTETVDTGLGGNNWNGSVFTVPVGGAGIYHVSASLRATAFIGLDERFYFYINGSNSDMVGQTTGNSQSTVMNGTVSLSDGDTLSIRTTANLTLFNAASLHRIIIVRGV